MIIYLARNSKNGKAYVGKTKRTLEVRWREHQHEAITGSMLAFHCAIRKHGVGSFELRVLQECSNKQDLNAAEVEWIAALETFVGDHPDKGYNMTKGGDGGGERLSGYVISEETRAKLSAAAKKRYAAGHGAYMRSRRRRGKEHPRYGVGWGRKGPLTETARAKISRARTGTKLSDEHKQAIADGSNAYYATHAGPNKDKPWSETTRKKNMSLRHLRKKPVFGYDKAGTCVIAYLSLEDAMAVTGLGYRVLTGDRKKYRPKYNDGITYRRSELTIAELRKM